MGNEFSERRLESFFRGPGHDDGPGGVDAQFGDEGFVLSSSDEVLSEDLPVGVEPAVFAGLAGLLDGLTDHGGDEGAVEVSFDGGGDGGVGLFGGVPISGVGAFEFAEVEAEGVDEPMAEAEAAASPAVEEPRACEAVGEEAVDDLVGVADPPVAGAEEVDLEGPGVEGHDVSVDLTASRVALVEVAADPGHLGEREDVGVGGGSGGPRGGHGGSLPGRGSGAKVEGLRAVCALARVEDAVVGDGEAGVDEGLVEVPEGELAGVGEGGPGAGEGVGVGEALGERGE